MTEFRVLPEFRKYEITAHGDIRNRETKKVLKEIENTKTGCYSYALYRCNGTSTQRTFWGLVYSAYPELLAEWKNIPGFPGYQVNRKGQVQGMRWYNIIPVSPKGFVRLCRDGKRHLWCIGDIGDEQDWEDFWNGTHPIFKETS